MKTRVDLEFDLVGCRACGILFAVPAQFLQQLLEDEGRLWCPNGHPLRFSGKEGKMK